MRATRWMGCSIAVAALFLTGPFAGPARAQSKQPVTHEVLWLMPRVGAPSPSPDGRWVVFSVTEPAYDKKEQSSDLWIVPADGSAKPRRLTSTKAAESGTAWSADSRRIAFVTRREGDEQSQIYVLDLGRWRSDETDQCFDRRQLPAVASRRSRHAVPSRVYPDATTTRRIGGSRRSERNRNTPSGRSTSFPVRRWDRWLDERSPTSSCSRSSREQRRSICSPGRELVRSPGMLVRNLDSRATSSTRSGLLTDSRSSLPPPPAATPAAYATVHTHLYQVPAGGGRTAPTDQWKRHLRASALSSRRSCALLQRDG